MKAEVKIIIGSLVVAIVGLVLLFTAMNFVYLILLWIGAIMITQGMILIMTQGFK